MPSGPKQTQSSTALQFAATQLAVVVGIITASVLSLASCLGDGLDTWHVRNGARQVRTLMDDILCDGSQFVAVGDSGLIETSPDGRNWTERKPRGGGSLRAIAFGNGRWVAVGHDVGGRERLATSSDPGISPAQHRPRARPRVRREHVCRCRSGPGHPSIRPADTIGAGDRTPAETADRDRRRRSDSHHRGGGSSPLTYEWYKDGILSCVSAGPEWRFDSTAPVDNGVYQVVATNPLGSVVSLPARLTVESDQPWLNVRLVAGAIQIEIFGSIGRVCRIEATESLNPAALIWEPLTDVTITSVPFTWTDPNPSQRPSRHRFYRVLQGPPMP